MPKKYAIIDPDAFFLDFPKLPRTLKPSSTATGDYLCFSLAVGDMKKIWAPEPYCWWLPKVPRSRATRSFVMLFEALGFEKCGHGDYERGVRKVAIFSIQGSVKHVAVQPPDQRGRWHSKIGGNVNIYHSIDELSGPKYGRVVQYMREKKPSPANRVRSSATLNPPTSQA